MDAKNIFMVYFVAICGLLALSNARQVLPTDATTQVEVVASLTTIQSGFLRRHAQVQGHSNKFAEQSWPTKGQSSSQALSEASQPR